MITRTLQPDQQPGDLTWRYRLDLTGLSPAQQAVDANALVYGGVVGRTVTIHVGSLNPDNPDQVDPRVTSFLADALARGVSLHLEGSPTAVGAWWHWIVGPTGRPAGRRLRPVTSS